MTSRAPVWIPFHEVFGDFQSNYVLFCSSEQTYFLAFVWSEIQKTIMDYLHYLQSDGNSGF